METTWLNCFFFSGLVDGKCVSVCVCALVLYIYLVTICVSDFESEHFSKVKVFWPLVFSGLFEG